MAQIEMCIGVDQLGTRDPGEQLSFGIRLIEQAYQMNSDYLQQTILELTTQVNEQEQIIEELNTKNSSLNEDLDLQKHSTKMLVERLDDRESKIQDLENQNKCLERIRKDIVNAMGLREPNKSASEQAPPASQMHTPLRHQFNVTDHFNYMPRQGSRDHHRNSSQSNLHEPSILMRNQPSTLEGQSQTLTAREIQNSTAKIFSDFDKQHKQLMKQLNIGTGLPNQSMAQQSHAEYQQTMQSLETFAQIRNAPNKPEIATAVEPHIFKNRSEIQPLNSGRGSTAASRELNRTRSAASIAHSQNNIRAASGAESGMSHPRVNPLDFKRLAQQQQTETSSEITAEAGASNHRKPISGYSKLDGGQRSSRGAHISTHQQAAYDKARKQQQSSQNGSVSNRSSKPAAKQSAFHRRNASQTEQSHMPELEKTDTSHAEIFQTQPPVPHQINPRQMMHPGQPLARNHLMSLNDEESSRPPSLLTNYDCPRFSEESKSEHHQQKHQIMDGRQLFKVVKQRISADKFQKFLKVIKALNGQQISKDAAMAQIESDVLGTENKDLFPTLYQILHPSQHSVSTD